jgi:hypothetical protein
VRRRKVTYPPPKTATKGPPPVLGATDPRNPSARTVSINLSAVVGRASIRLGDRVRITSGLYSGEIATVESVAGGVIPAVTVRTEAGRARRARTIDLEPVRPGSELAEPQPGTAPEG